MNAAIQREKCPTKWRKNAEKMQPDSIFTQLNGYNGIQFNWIELNTSSTINKKIWRPMMDVICDVTSAADHFK